MAQWLSFVLVVVATTTTTIAVTESRAIPAEPVSVMLDPYGNPIVFLREKRTAVRPYPQRAMMFTGYYRPVRRSSHGGGQATGVFAQGNAVSGEAFFGGMQTPPHLNNGPEPIEQSEISSAEAQAAPAPEDSYNEDDRTGVQPAGGYQPEEHHPQQGHYPQDGPHNPQNEYPAEGEQDHRKQSGFPPQEQPESEQSPSAFTTEAASVSPTEEPVYPTTEAAAKRPKVNRGKKTKKPPVVVHDNDDEDDDDDDDDDEEDDATDEEPSVPFVPFKGNRRRQNYPNLNNYFPMVFSFPGGSTRSGSSGSPPGAVTAIANSYSTGKGGVASSVATAYGGSPNGKKRRTPTTDE
ncbi:PREDICTED: chromodomain-helicase-DNA-binding protein 1 [Dufourea novaeangliae]|uniref:chromodomain-helicase-DNA-binding protein 1 n=1 Tax=Dufourea novaeangliae TaxID=178035 RepID=UPI00076799AE|nr:PREDICTED: chromodomain-helicase-DNA-binding protein 1 [Dufourea novaeangliae]